MVVVEMVCDSSVVSHMWVAQTCESVKQATQIAFAVTTYE